MNNLTAPHFHDDDAARAYLESVRWPNGPVCPHCGEAERKHYKLPNKTRRLWKCAKCRKQFTVTVGTVARALRRPVWDALHRLAAVGAVEVEELVVVAQLRRWSERVAAAPASPPGRSRSAQFAEPGATLG